MAWEVRFTKAARRDIDKLGEPRRSHVQTALKKVSQNPLPASEGGYGKPLGSHAKGNLTGLLKVKLRGDGIRIVYRLERRDETMVVIVVGVRDDDEVYQLALKRASEN